MSGGDSSGEGGLNVSGGIDDSNDALGNSGSSISNGVGAIVRCEMDVDGSSDDAVGSVQGDLVVGVVVVSSSVSIVEADDSHISKMSVVDRWDSVDSVEGVVVSSSGSSIGVGDISPPVQMESMVSSNSVDYGKDIGIGTRCGLNKVNPSGDVRSRSGLEVASSVGDGKAVVGISRSSKDGRVNNSNDSSGQSGSSVSSVGSNTIINKFVEDHSSSNDRVVSK